MLDILVTTTPNIEYGVIKNYLGTVHSNVVIGTNIFSDILASFTDVFGGKSETYQRKLELIRNDAINELKLKAFELGANAIISLQIDFDEISAQGKAMFMVSATGTACLVDINENIKSIYEITGISLDQINDELTKQAVFNKVKDKKDLDDDDLVCLMCNPCREVVDKLIDLYIDSYYSQKLQFLQAYFLNFLIRILRMWYMKDLRNTLVCYL